MLLTIRDIAARLRVARSTAQVLASKPGFPRPIRLGARIVRYREDELAKWIERQGAR